MARMARGDSRHMEHLRGGEGVGEYTVFENNRNKKEHKTKTAAVCPMINKLFCSPS